MEHPGFFERAGPFALGEVIEKSEAQPGPNTDVGLEISDVLPLDIASDGHLSFIDNKKYLKAFLATGAAACFVGERYAERTPDATAAVLTDQPYRSFALALAMFYPEALTPISVGPAGENFVNGVHKSAEVAESAIIEPSAVVGPEARVGAGSVIASGAQVGYRVHVGKDCYIGPGVSLTNALVGNGVILHGGVRVGHDGFGFAMGPKGHLKVPQIGRVIIEDGVEIGSNSTVDRGALRDTIIGAGTKIDNLVQIGHNVVIGRMCVIVSHVGISGSAVLGDGVVLGGKVGVSGHVTVGSGAQIAATSNVNSDVPPGAKWGGTPAKPISEWFREIATVQRITQERIAARRKGETS